MVYLACFYALLLLKEFRHGCFQKFAKPKNRILLTDWITSSSQYGLSVFLTLVMVLVEKDCNLQPKDRQRTRKRERGS